MPDQVRKEIDVTSSEHVTGSVVVLVGTSCPGHFVGSLPGAGLDNQALNHLCEGLPVSIDISGLNFRTRDKPHEVACVVLSSVGTALHQFCPPKFPVRVQLVDEAYGIVAQILASNDESYAGFHSDFPDDGALWGWLNALAKLLGKLLEPAGGQLRLAFSEIPWGVCTGWERPVLKAIVALFCEAVNKAYFAETRV